MMGDETYKLVVQFIENDKKAIEFYTEGKINFPCMMEMKIRNADNFTNVLNALSRMTYTDDSNSFIRDFKEE